VLLQASLLDVGRSGRRVIKGVNFDLRAGEVVGLIGPNGAGKSTLLEALAGLSAETSGDIKVNGQPIEGFNRTSLARTRAYLAQDADIHWPLLVEKLVELGRLPHGRGTSAEDRCAVAQAMALTDIESIAARCVNELSGGEAMRVAIARLLAVEAPLLLLDEPIAGLDPRYQLEILNILKSQAKSGCGIVLVLHDLELAARYCDKLVLLKDGEVFSEGSPESVLSVDSLARVYGVDAEVDFRESLPRIRLLDITAQSGHS
jgi:iron complex transport system ATP-binding protein